MNLDRVKQRIVSIALGAILSSSIFLSSCGGGADVTAGIGGTGIVSGTITDFGSIYVNGNKFDTGRSQFIVDGDADANQEDLAVGMVVRLRVDTEDGVYTGTAIEVVYDELIEGPIEAPGPVLDASGNKKTFDILDQTIVVDQNTTVFNGTSFDGIADAIAAGDVLEVSGFRISPTDVVATYVENKGTLPGDTQVELKGIISDFSNTMFKLGKVTVTYDNSVPVELPDGVSLGNDLTVEVKGVYQSATLVDAVEIEFEDDIFGDEVDEVSLQGIIAQYASDAEFYVNGQLVDASQASFSPSNAELVDGINVEVEGDIVAGVLIAEELELRNGNVELRSIVGVRIDPAANQFEVDILTLGTILVNINGQTLFKDEAGPTPLEDLSINDLMPMDFVRIEGQEVNGEVVASIVKRTDPGETELQGAVDSFILNTSITILGITYRVDATPVTGTIFEGGSASAFFGQLMNGNIVEIKDDPADGEADEVEFED